jgi:hypothetical protein
VTGSRYLRRHVLGCLHSADGGPRCRAMHTHAGAFALLYRLADAQASDSGNGDAPQSE